MSSDRLKIDELSARLSVDPEFTKILLCEMASQITKEYLTIDELAKRLSWEKRTVENKMEARIFKRGVHYFHPKGIRPRFKWSAIVKWLEEDKERIKDNPTSVDSPLGDRIPMARGYTLGDRRQKKSAAPS